jgi:hypothetical protein
MSMPILLCVANHVVDRSALPLLRSLLRRILPRRAARYVRDLEEDLRRRRQPPHRGLPEYDLTASQIYPKGNQFDECLRAGIAPMLDGLVIRKETPVASIGSCFADEFASHMREIGFNYIAAESPAFPVSANWGRVYTIPCFRQIVEYSIDDDFALPIEQSPRGWFDPLREPTAGHFPTREHAELGIHAHRAASRHVLASARVLIVTLGQNEAWVDRHSGLVWAHRPPDEMLSAKPDRFESRAFSFEDDTAWLEEALARLRALNPQLDILLTVSPVASYATFAGAEAITQSFAGKAVLRAVADRMTRVVPRLWYFPAFEMALAYNPHTLQSDNRHVKNATIDRIFALLHATVVR